MTDHLDPSDSANIPGPDQWDAVARFLSAETSAGDAADIRQWLSEHPGDAGVVASLDRLLPASAHDAQLAQGSGTLPFGRPIDVEGALRRVHAQMETTVSAPMLSVTGEPRKLSGTSRVVVSPRWPWSKGLWAAAAAVIAVVGYTRFNTGGEAGAAVAQTYSTPIGARDSVTLSDGSKVILAPGSKLTVAANYQKGDRSVELEGAGQFTVHHDAKHPFSVRSGAALIQDLGTVFTVDAVQGVGVVVAVTEGSVSLSDSSASGRSKAVSLAAGDRGRLRTDGSVVSERGSVTPDESAWVVGKLVYRDAHLAQVQADLRRWYGVELVVSDSSLRALSVTTEAMTSESVDKLIGKLTTLWGAVATRRGDTLFVDRSGDRPKH